jgi:RNA-binding protein 39
LHRSQERLRRSHVSSVSSYLSESLLTDSSQTDPHWAKDLEEDFKEECSSKYGKVVHIGVFRDSSDGEIYVKFADLAGGDSALKGLNGRYFDGRTLTATPVVDAVYNMNFPKAASL